MKHRQLTLHILLVLLVVAGCQKNEHMLSQKDSNSQMSLTAKHSEKGTARLAEFQKLESEFKSSLEKSDFARAKEIVETFRKLTPESPENMNRLYHLRLAQGRLRDAFEARRAMLYPRDRQHEGFWDINSSDALMDYALLAEKISEKQEYLTVIHLLADRALEKDWGTDYPKLKVIKRDETTDRALAYVFTAERDSSNPGFSHDSYVKALDLLPDNVSILLQAADHYWYSEMPHTAIRLLRKAYSLGTKNDKDWIRDHQWIYGNFGSDKLLFGNCEEYISKYPD